MVLQCIWRGAPVSACRAPISVNVPADRWNCKAYSRRHPLKLRLPGNANGWQPCNHADSAGVLHRQIDHRTQSSVTLVATAPAVGIGHKSPRRPRPLPASAAQAENRSSKSRGRFGIAELAAHARSRPLHPNRPGYRINRASWRDHCRRRRWSMVLAASWPRRHNPKAPVRGQRLIINNARRDLPASYRSCGRSASQTRHRLFRMSCPVCAFNCVRRCCPGFILAAQSPQHLAKVGSIPPS